MASLLATLAVIGLLVASLYVLLLLGCGVLFLIDLIHERHTKTVNIIWEMEPQDELEEMLSRPERFTGFIDAERVGWLP